MEHRKRHQGEPTLSLAPPKVGGPLQPRGPTLGEQKLRTDASLKRLIIYCLMGGFVVTVGASLAFTALGHPELAREMFTAAVALAGVIIGRSQTQQHPPQLPPPKAEP